METTLKSSTGSQVDKGRSQDEGMVERTATAAHNTVDKVAAAASPGVDRLASSAHQVVDKVAGAVGTAADVASEKADQLKAQQERLLEDCRDYVRANPLTALGIAVGAGYILSRVLSRR